VVPTYRNLSITRTQIACRLHAVLCDLVAGGVPDEIYAEKAASLLAEVEPDSAVAAAASSSPATWSTICAQLRRLQVRGRARRMAS
jgi:hypothetical protein